MTFGSSRKVKSGHLGRPIRLTFHKVLKEAAREHRRVRLSEHRTTRENMEKKRKKKTEGSVGRGKGEDTEKVRDRRQKKKEPYLRCRVAFSASEAQSILVNIMRNSSLCLGPIADVYCEGETQRTLNREFSST